RGLNQVRCPHLIADNVTALRVGIQGEVGNGWNIRVERGLLHQIRLLVETVVLFGIGHRIVGKAKIEHSKSTPNYCFRTSGRSREFRRPRKTEARREIVPVVDIVLALPAQSGAERQILSDAEIVLNKCSEVDLIHKNKGIAAAQRKLRRYFGLIRLAAF